MGNNTTVEDIGQLAKMEPNKAEFICAVSKKRLTQKKTLGKIVDGKCPFVRLGGVSDY